MGWEPVLDGRLADDARAAVRAIADEIGDHHDDASQPDHVALFWAYAAGAFDDAASEACFDAAVAALVTRIEAGYRVLGLHGGLAGAGFVLAHVADSELDFLGSVDDALTEVLAADPWRGDHDLIAGLTGFGVYFLERLATTGAATARAGLDRVVDRLASTAEITDAGVTWHTRPGLLPAWQRESWPTGYYNCGVAHGTPGTIALLGRIAALADPPPRARELCDGAIRWLRSRRMSPDPAGSFPSFVVDDRPVERARTAWCYGDPGIAAAVWSATARTGSPSDEWRDLARAVAARPRALCRIHDAGLCHGAVGLAHLFNRCYQASRDPVFRDAARAWFADALAMRGPHGIGGFVRHPATRDDTRIVSDNLLEGAAGIGLGLLAALHPEEPGWDRLLACDLPAHA